MIWLHLLLLLLRLLLWLAIWVAHLLLAIAQLCRVEIHSLRHGTTSGERRDSVLVLLWKYRLRDVTLVTLLTLRLLLWRWAVGARIVRLLARVCRRMDLGLVREVLLWCVHCIEVSFGYGGTYSFLTMLL